MSTIRRYLTPDQIIAYCQRGMTQQIGPDIIKALRESQDLHQRQVARELGHSPETVRSWERPYDDKHFRPMKRPARIAFCQYILDLATPKSVTQRAA